MQIDGGGITGIKPPKAYPIPNHDNLSSSYGVFGKALGDDSVILRISKSSLNTFQFCEQQYFIKYILGVKEAENDDMRRGTNVHDAVEDFYDNLNIPLALKSLEDFGPNGVAQMFFTYIPLASKEKEWGGVVTPSYEFQLGEQKHLERFMIAEANRFVSSDPLFFKPVINEDSLDAVIDLEVDGKVVLVHITGIIDRGFQDKEGNIHLHELKTGLWKHTDFKKEGMQKEMALYV